MIIEKSVCAVVNFINIQVWWSAQLWEWAICGHCCATQRSWKCLGQVGATAECLSGLFCSPSTYLWCRML